MLPCTEGLKMIDGKARQPSRGYIWLVRISGASIYRVKMELSTTTLHQAQHLRTMMNTA